MSHGIYMLLPLSLEKFKEHSCTPPAKYDFEFHLLQVRTRSLKVMQGHHKLVTTAFS